MEEATKEPKRSKRHGKKALRKVFEPKSVEELDVRQFLERVERRYHEMKARRDKEPG